MFLTKRAYWRKPSHAAPVRGGRRGQGSRSNTANNSVQTPAAASPGLAAYWAFCERGGWSVENLAGPEGHLSVSTLGAVTWAPKVGRDFVRGDGCVARCSGSAGGYLTAGNPTDTDPTAHNQVGYAAGWSCLIRFRFVALPGAASGVFSIGDTAVTGSPAYLLQLNTPSTLRVLLGDVTYQTLTSSAAAGTWYTVVSTATGAVASGLSITEAHYLNGRPVYSGALTCGTSRSANVYVASGFNGVTNIDVDVVALANRCWGPDECKRYSETPWLLLDAGQPPRALKAASGSSVARTAADAPTTSDAAARAGGFARAVAGAPTTTDAVTRAGGFTRTAADGPASSDDAAASKLYPRAAADAPTTSDAAARAGGFTRAPADAPTISDAAARTLAAPRTAADAPASSDAAGRVLAAPRAGSDAPATSDAVTRAGAFARATAGAPTTSDAAARALTAPRAAADVPSTSDAAARTGAFARTLTAAPTTSDSVTAIKGGAVSAADAPTTSDAAGRALTAARATADAPATADAAARTLSSARAAADAAAVAGSAARAVTAGRAAADAAATADAAARAVGFTRALGDSPATTDLVTRTGAFARTLADAAASADVVTATGSFLLADAGVVVRAGGTGRTQTVLGTSRCTVLTAAGRRTVIGGTR